MMHWSSIGSLLYGTVFVIESRHRKMLILCVISAGELTICANVAKVCTPMLYLKRMDVIFIMHSGQADSLP